MVDDDDPLPSRVMSPFVIVYLALIDSGQLLKQPYRCNDRTAVFLVINNLARITVDAKRLRRMGCVAGPDVFGQCVGALHTRVKILAVAGDFIHLHMTKSEFADFVELDATVEIPGLVL